MIKTIDNIQASGAFKDKIKMLYVQSDELAWLGEHLNRESDDTEIEFKDKRAEILKMRDQIISGQLTDFSAMMKQYDERFKDLLKYEKTLGKDYEDKWEEHLPKEVDHLKGKHGVSDFWKSIILTHPSLTDYITEEDKAVLDYVTALHVDMSFIKPSVVTVRMYFSENEYFTNEVLECTLRYEDSEEDTVEAVVGTEINWKSKTKNVTQKRIRKTQKHRDTGEYRIVVTHKQKQSFFNIFKSLEAPECVNSDCSEHEDKFDTQKQAFSKLSKHRKDKILDKQKEITDNLNDANNVAITLHDMYSKYGLENYLGFYYGEQKDEEEYDSEVEEEDQHSAEESDSENNWVSDEDDSDSESSESSSSSEPKPKKGKKKMTSNKKGSKTKKATDSGSGTAPLAEKGLWSNGEQKAECKQQ